ncbi:MAG TPA: 4Fe-4S dicluster domain-containing protein, partial [Candidatus Acidoferrales bacterium]|nr:4Fe-4S dicluster domain-containing protein [Candidatus Acidoferrales bacterium]
MATVITSECINCGACEPECPNTAIYQGGVEYELNGVMHPPLSNDIFYIVPEKCTECVGFFDQEACAVVCPVDCCVPDPARPEPEEALIARARELHPDKTFEATFPSRFRKDGAEAPAAGNGAASAAPAAAPTTAPAAAKAAPAASAAVGGRVEKALSPPRVKVAAPLPPMKEKTFPGELPGSFESALARLGGGQARRSPAVKWLVALAQPLLGALPYAQKQRIEDFVSDRRYFTAAGSTGVNALHNMILYPAVLVAFGALSQSAGAGAVDKVKPLFSSHLVGLITAGMALALFETMWRMQEGLRAMPLDQIKYRGSVYGYPLGIVFQPLMRILGGPVQRGTVAVDGFSGGNFEEKQERERRYGEVYSIEDRGNGYLVRLEFPRRVPHSAMKDELGIP